MDKGAWGMIHVNGEARPDLFFGDSSGSQSGH
jgi:hypothetical protein